MLPACLSSSWQHPLHPGDDSSLRRTVWITMSDPMSFL
jgi:hypothetical protein